MKKQYFLYSSSFRSLTFCRRAGMTVMELLVVVGIMSILLMISVPMMRPVAEDRAAREGVRGLQAALETARMRAAKLGRPCGLALIPYVTDSQSFPTVCVKCEQVTCPPNYSGDTTDARCSVSGKKISGIDSKMLAPGNWIRINNTGPWLEIDSSQSVIFPEMSHTAGGDSEEFIPFWEENKVTNGKYPYNVENPGKYPYTIRRYPINNKDLAFQKALGTDAPLVFPRGIVVDLRFSGVSLSTPQNNQASDDRAKKILTRQWTDLKYSNGYPPIMIMFYPSGGVEIYYGGKAIMIPAFIGSGSGHTVDGGGDHSPKIYLLVGQWNRALPDYPAPDGLNNIQDPNSFWVVINPRTGLVTSAMNNPSDDVLTAREFAKIQKEGMGGQ
ncbi:MAG: hypothetical protein Q4C96_05860 [Planctomycetia bacterium]|nr:hypothetical protein [Planctomycetia bacterium]